MKSAVDAVVPVGFARLRHAADPGGRAAAQVRRLHHPGLRRGPAQLAAAARLACLFVLLVGWFYLLPQMRGAD
jgi:hypothetical protein